MGRRNYLIEGVSGTGKTAVCTELERRGYQAIHGDRELVYRGDPETGLPTGMSAPIGRMTILSARFTDAPPNGPGFEGMGSGRIGRFTPAVFVSVRGTI